MNDARRQEPQNEGFIPDVNRMTGVVPALIARDDVEPVRQQINNFSLSFVAPLSADYYNYHSLIFAF
jgi:hypothetical protein